MQRRGRPEVLCGCVGGRNASHELLRASVQVHGCVLEVLCVHVHALTLAVGSCKPTASSMRRASLSTCVCIRGCGGGGGVRGCWLQSMPAVRGVHPKTQPL